MRVRASLFLFVLAAMAMTAGSARPASTAEEQTARYFESIRHDPLLLLAFLRDMPKGGDLHNHLSGAIYAESYVEFAARDGVCVDRKTLALSPPPCDEVAGRPLASEAWKDAVLYRQMIDAFSMRHFVPGAESAHDHFFDAFGKFGLVSRAHTGEMLAEVTARAAEEHVSYLELIVAIDRSEAALLGARLGWDDDLSRFREKLLSNGLAHVVAASRQYLDASEAKMRELLRCQSAHPDAGCSVLVRYQYEIYRGFPPEQVFAQTLGGFEVAQVDSRVAGINMVMPEDGYISMRDFSLHMRMLEFLHRQYPRVRISLHAGELAPGLVPPEGLRFHIRESVERGHAERIGHGVDVMHERDPMALLREMAERKVLVEICLSSNDMILGIRGSQEPLMMYMHQGVPVALATDDPGVARSSMTGEYQRAVETYNLGYAELKKMTRDSLEYSFIPGTSLWAADSRQRREASACASEKPAAQTTSSGCQGALAKSERARAQWGLEAAFARFEQKYSQRNAPSGVNQR